MLAFTDVSLQEISNFIFQPQVSHNFVVYIYECC